jgi:hypothetical protein
LTSANPDGKRIGVFLACTLDGRAIGTGHFDRLGLFDPQQFMVKYKRQVHNSFSAAGID